MPSQELRTKSLEAAKFDPQGSNYIRDTVVRGLEFKVGKGGTKTFYLLYNNRAGKKQRLKVGNFPETTLANAREQAGLTKGRVREEGFDPVGEKRVAKSGGPRKPTAHPLTISDAAEQFMEQHVRKNNKRPESRQFLFDRYLLPYWADLAVADLSRQHGIDLVEVLEEKHGPTTANRAVQLAKAMVNWLLDRNKTALQFNPLLRIKAAEQEKSRDRVLKADEIRSIMGDLEDRDTIFADIVRVLLYTGQRRAEVGGMSKGEIDLKTKVWSLPGERTKNGRPHEVHLSDPVVAILERRMASAGGDLLFSANDETPFSAWARSKERLDKRSKVTGWRLHDIRRTVVTGMLERLDGRPYAQPHIVEAVVNHVSGAAKAGVAGTYNRAIHRGERIQLLDAWASYLDNAILAADDKVVPLRG